MGKWEKGGARQECDLQRHLTFAGSMLENERGQGVQGGLYPFATHVSQSLAASSTELSELQSPHRVSSLLIRASP